MIRDPRFTHEHTCSHKLGTSFDPCDRDLTIPLYPGSESKPAQQKPFPAKPNFGEIGSRTGALIAESSISKEIALAWAAISLRTAGVSAEKVQERTGLNIAYPPLELTILAPDGRLGWDTLRFDPNEMRVMFVRGLNAEPRALIP